MAYGSTLPSVGTEIAQDWDTLYYFLVYLSILFFVPVIGAMVAFAIKYKRKEGVKPADIHGHLPLEIIWTAIPTVLVMIIFAWGWVVYKEMVTAPWDAYEINVTGKKWMWSAQYDHGPNLLNELYVPAGEPVKLIMTAEDVLHGFFIPDFRVKSDVVPGMYTHVWFEAKQPGDYPVYCTEYCGNGHSRMLATIHVLNREDWMAWKAGKAIGGDQNADLPLDQQGAKLATSKGCTACHSADGTAGVGPSFKGIYGKTEVFEDGSSGTVDENYLRESIEYPGKKLVKGYGPSMPAFKGLFKESELNAIIAYIKSLK